MGATNRKSVIPDVRRARKLQGFRLRALRSGTQEHPGPPGQASVFLGTGYRADARFRDDTKNNPTPLNRTAPVPRQVLVSSAGASSGSGGAPRAEEHTSELQSLMRIQYAGFCLKRK